MSVPNPQPPAFHTAEETEPQNQPGPRLHSTEQMQEEAEGVRCAWLSIMHWDLQVTVWQGEVLVATVPFILDVQQRVDGAPNAQRVEQVGQVLHGLQGAEYFLLEPNPQTSVNTSCNDLTRMEHKQGKKLMICGQLCDVVMKDMSMCVYQTHRTHSPADVDCDFINILAHPKQTSL